MNTVFEKMEYCAANVPDAAAFTQTAALLEDGNWRVRYAAAIALGDRRDPRAVDALLQVLRRENALPLFTQPKLEGSAHAGSSDPYEVIFPQGTTEATKESWRCRGRVMQAACLALGNIGKATPAVLALLHDFATGQERDYAVRAAACKAMGQIASKESLPVLEKASQDEEWCTSCEARKAVGKIRAAA
jgi:HEAT repeat protein